jgi:hypothetical protein
MKSPTDTEGWAEAEAEAEAEGLVEGFAGAVGAVGERLALVDGAAGGFGTGGDEMTARPVFRSYEATLRDDFFAVPPSPPSATAVGVAVPEGADTTASCSWAAAGPGVSAAALAAGSVVVGELVEQPVMSTAARVAAVSKACLLSLGLCTRVPRERGMGVRFRR